MNVLVYGLGALGSVYAALLKKAGHHVTAMVRPNILDDVQKQGVHVQGIWGEHHYLLDEVVASLQDCVRRDWELIIVTVKSFAITDAAKAIAAVRSPDSFVLLTQNGYGNYEASAEHIPEKNLLVSTVFFGAESLGPGASNVKAMAEEIRLGSPGNRISQAEINKWIEFFREASMPTQPTDQIMKYVWGKITFNSVINSLGALLETTPGMLVENPNARELMRRLIVEIYSLLITMGQQTICPDVESYLSVFFNKLVPHMKNHCVSMLQDLRRGRPTEVDSLNGAIVRLGKRYGVSTPTNEMLTHLLKTKESIVLTGRAD
ncbi:2-dehydropantoate 2-reductase [Heliobacterium gestii]|uniref:2-dehydropantoate 2-reductase n=1 Tax=Heliomicrobium gestii TaxID=2699 RepID=A0A845LB29_HELGE|nr:2-dehydropantoate 2-reductase [Heliomicrobium gestii]MBM7866159.1 2-dehydropantoate 2-reductase [Heliomicrobium gestii]MZP42514.1 2-dehydropantoate 2-reductase [Heliomicrobium gestii]